MERGQFHLAALVIGTLLGAPALAQVTVRATLNSNEFQQNGSSFDNVISSDGRYVAFESTASNLVSGDTNGAHDIFVRDRILGTTERVSVDSSGAQSNADPNEPFSPYISMSRDGLYVAFQSEATNLVPGDTNGRFDIFLRDRQLGTTERVTVDSNEVQANDWSRESSISTGGRYVAFMSYASNLVAADTNGRSDIFVRDRLNGTTERVSIATNGTQANSNSQNAVISADGRYVVFTSYADNLVANDTNGNPDVFLRDRVTGTTTRVSMGISGQEPDASCNVSAISADGRFVAFESDATNLVPNDTNNLWDAFVCDRQTGINDRVSVSTTGVQGGSWAIQFPAPGISDDGRYAVFSSDSNALVNGDTNGVIDIFLRDRLLGTTQRVSVGTEGVQADDNSISPWISASGRFVSFASGAGNLVAGDTNHAMDIFVRDLAPAGFTSLCDPGVAGVIACPCGNPPNGSGRGCDNSAATGGAALTPSGVAYVTMDSLRFIASGERPTSLSILTQWTGGHFTGITLGMGVRCTSGSFKRLFTKNAVAGTFTAPDFPGGDPTISARSAALGNVIGAGSSRWYFVYYRDPNVLGGCSPASTFNMTQTGRIDWSL